MTTPLWQGGRLTLPGDLVQPTQRPVASAVPLVNADFEDGTLTGWDVTREGGTAGTFSNATDRPYAGTRGAKWTGAAGTSRDGIASIWLNTAQGPVTPGQRLTVRAMIAQDDTGSSANWGAARIYWFQQNGTPCTPAYTHGNEIAGNFNDYRLSTASGTAPANAAYARAGLWLSANGSGAMRADAVTWDHAPPVSDGTLIFKAVQASSAHTGSAEPAWPGVLGQTVVDGGVTWEAVNTSRVVWQALPLLKTGPIEPAWPTVPGAFVADGSVSWECVSRSIEDAKCPHSTVVAIAQSKVFAADGDIVRFCATANPLDWSAEADAGFLPTGLQQANADGIAVLNLYRSNLAALNPHMLQLWQIDPDPEAMALLDQLDGIGSSWQVAAQPVANDLFYLTPQGVRSIGIAAGADRISSGDVGDGIDVLVRASLAAGNPTASAYYPAAGQYWLAFGSTVYVDTLGGSRHRWGRYTFPASVEAFAQLADDLYIRTAGDCIVMVDPDVNTDAIVSGGGFGAQAIDGLVQWGYLDLGQPAVSKELEGFDLVATGNPSVSVGYDQRDPNAFTTPYAAGPDTVPGDIIPLPVVAPTLSLKVTFAGAPFRLDSATLYLQDRRAAT